MFGAVALAVSLSPYFFSIVSTEARKSKLVSPSHVWTLGCPEESGLPAPLPPSLPAAPHHPGWLGLPPSVAVLHRGPGREEPVVPEAQEEGFLRPSPGIPEGQQGS